MSEPLRVELAEDDGPVALQDFLERRWPDVHRAYLRQLVAAGSVRVNFVVAAPRMRLRSGDVVELSLEPGESMPPAPASSAELPRVLHRDDRWLVVDKPAGWRLTDRAGDSLQAWLADSGLGDGWHPVWRMDADASGCAVWVEGRAALGEAQARFAAGGIRLEWAALVEGVVARPEMSLSHSLGPDRGRPGRVRTVAQGTKGSRRALTEVTVTERFRRHSLVRCVPRTDHGHQVRAHLAGAHHAIVGDGEYRGRPQLFLSHIKSGYKMRRGAAEKPLLVRMFLHATRLVDGETVVAEAALAADLAIVVDKLRRFASKH